MLSALTNESAYALASGLTVDQLALLGDANGDGAFTNADIQSLLDLLKSGGGSTSPVPEPAAGLLMIFAMPAAMLLRGEKARNWADWVA
jgi:hypothetical protein